ncbi:MAG: sodium:solute symporter family protein [Eubacterium sp.]|nr:sodium:solute symporter family protein [Eubacterium sp.]
MNSTALTVLLVIYITALIIIGIFDLRKAKSFSDFAVAGKKQRSFFVIMSLLATVLGASTTMGISNTTYVVGFPAVWWLVFGVIGLLLQALFISEKVRGLNADTLPHAAGIMLGRPAELIISIIIVVSWIGVIAGQLVALNNMIRFVTGKNSKTVFIIVAVAIILYTTIGGQLSVIKTDVIQFAVIVIGILTCFIYLYFFSNGDNSILGKIELINDSYRPINLVTQFFVIGGVYFLGPDIISRNLVSKDRKTAKKAAMIGGFVLLAYSVIIVLIGLWIRSNVGRLEMDEMNPLMYIMKNKIPPVAGAILMFGLLSAILSSIDTCVINASSIFVKDILKKDDIRLVRGAVVGIGMIALWFTLSGNGDIISFLSNAYSVYTPGVIFPLLIAILCYKKKEIRVSVWVAAVACGGVFGFMGGYFPEIVAKLPLPEFCINNFSLLGMGISLLIALTSIKWGEKLQESAGSTKRIKTAAFNNTSAEL